MNYPTVPQLKSPDQQSYTKSNLGINTPLIGSWIETY